MRKSPGAFVQRTNAPRLFYEKSAAPAEGENRHDEGIAPYGGFAAAQLRVKR